MRRAWSKSRALESATTPADQAQLLMCRARVRSNQWLTREVCEDAVAAMTLFEMAGDDELAIAAASLGAAHASRLGEVALASDLATRSILGLDSVSDNRLRWEITNRLGIFCYSLFDYDRAVEMFEVSLAAAERLGDEEKVCRQLQNIADALLLASRQQQRSHLGTGADKLERAEATVRRLRLEGSAELNRRFGSHRLLAEVLCDLGRGGGSAAGHDRVPGRGERHHAGSSARRHGAGRGPMSPPGRPGGGSLGCRPPRHGDRRDEPRRARVDACARGAGRLRGGCR